MEPGINPDPFSHYDSMDPRSDRGQPCPLDSGYQLSNPLASKIDPGMGSQIIRLDHPGWDDLGSHPGNDLGSPEFLKGPIILHLND